MNRVFSIKAAGLTDTGRVRLKNEDAVWVDPDLDLLIVADGLGGHASGEKASGMAISTIPRFFKFLSQDTGQLPGGPQRLAPETYRLGLCLTEANRLIFEAGQANVHDHGMGCTCTAVYFHDNRLSLAHVGDSRCYLIRDGKITQLTEDHSLANEQLKRGLITAEEAAAGNQNILARAMGVDPSVEIDLDEHRLLAGDVVLMCSDGLNKELTDEEVLQVAAETPEPVELAERLIEMANAVRGRDNITVAVARVDKASNA